MGSTGVQSKSAAMLLNEICKKGGAEIKFIYDEIRDAYNRETVVFTCQCEISNLGGRSYTGKISNLLAFAIQLTVERERLALKLH